MSTERTTIQLKIASILDVPINSYEEDFTFVINGQEFRTSRLFSEILSSKICRIHLVDPTIDKYTINTNHQGQFQRIFDLINFQQNNIPDQEILFFIDVIEQIGNDSIHFISNVESSEIANDNIFKTFKIHFQKKFFKMTYLAKYIIYFNE